MVESASLRCAMFGHVPYLMPSVYIRALNRGVAQPGSALAWGASGRWFESSHPDWPRAIPEWVALFISHRLLERPCCPVATGTSRPGPREALLRALAVTHPGGSIPHAPPARSGRTRGPSTKDVRNTVGHLQVVLSASPRGTAALPCAVREIKKGASSPPIPDPRPR